MVPTAVNPYRIAAATLDVPPAPAMAAERAAFIAASTPWSRRGEKSISRPSGSGSPDPIESTIRAALVATAVWKLSWFRSSVSSSWPSMRGAVTRTSGSPANTTVPSGIASTSPEKRNAGQVLEEPAPNPSVSQVGELIVAEPHLADHGERRAEAGGEQPIASRRELAHEQLEHGRVVHPTPVVAGRHRKLVAVDQQRRLGG